MADHTAADHLFDTIETQNAGSPVKIEIVGMEHFKRIGNKEKSTRLLNIEREQLSIAG